MRKGNLHFTNLFENLFVFTIPYRRKYGIIHHLNKNTILPKDLTLLQRQYHNPRMLLNLHLRFQMILEDLIQAHKLLHNNLISWILIFLTLI